MASDSTDDRLIGEVLDGQLQSFEALIREHAARLKAFVAMRLPVSHLVDEIAHETFVFAYRHLEDFEIGSDFGKWLRAIAHNLVRKEVLRFSRSEKNRGKYLDHCLVQRCAAQGAAPRPDSSEVVYLEECLAALPKNQRKLLGERYRWSRTTRELAELTGRSEAWVRTNLCRLRATLRDCVENKIRMNADAAGEAGAGA